MTQTHRVAGVLAIGAMLFVLVNQSPGQHGTAATSRALGAETESALEIDSIETVLSPDGSIEIETTRWVTGDSTTLISENGEASGGGAASTLAIDWIDEPKLGGVLESLDIEVTEDWTVAAVGPQTDLLDTERVVLVNDVYDSDLGDPGDWSPGPDDPFNALGDWPKLRCDGDREDSDVYGTMSWQLACPQGVANWGFKLSSGLRSIIISDVYEHGLDWTQNGLARSRNAPHFVPKGYIFHGTIGTSTPIKPPDRIHFWDQFDFEINTGAATLFIEGHWRAAPKQ